VGGNRANADTRRPITPPETPGRELGTDTRLNQPTTSAHSRKSGKRFRNIGAYAVLALAVFLSAAACLNDLTPQGGWSAPVLEGEYFYVGNKAGRIARIEAQSGSFDHNWRATTDEDLTVVSDAPSTGFLGSCSAVPRGQAVYGSPLIKDGQLYAAGYACTGNDCEAGVFAVDLDSGAPIWRERVVHISTKIVGRLAMGEDTLVFGTSEVGANDDPRGYLYAINPTPDAILESEPVGVRIKWRFPTGGNVFSAPAVDNNVAYFGDMSGAFYAVDLADSAEYLNRPESRLLWKFQAGGAITAAPLIADGHIYFGDFGGNFYALSLSGRRDGSLSETALVGTGEWKFEEGDWTWAQALAHRGIVYAATLGGRVFAIDQQTGQAVWPAPAVIDGQIVAQPAIIDHARGPAIAVPSGKSDVYIVSQRDGTILGQLFTDGPVKSSPLVNEGFVYVHTESGELKTFSAGDLTERRCVETREGKDCG
jgi:outer membrane protein assembly factor BamB